MTSFSTRDRLRDLVNAEAKLREACQQLHRYLDESTTEEKRAILEMLAIKVTATADRVDIAGVIPLEPVQSAGACPCLLTTVRTSACLSRHAYTGSDPAVAQVPFRLEAVG